MAFLDTILGKWLMTIGIAMVPVVELRGAIPVGVAAGLSPWEAYLAAVVGNMLPVPVIMLLVRQVFEWLRHGKLWGPKIEKLEARANEKSGLVRKYRMPGLMLLVAIPLPGTGAWTGALVATLLNIRIRNALPVIALGVVIAGGITTALTYGVQQLF